MRVPNDKLMAASNGTDVVDLIFGGHDHTYFVELDPDTGVHVTKSASDFECFTNLTAYFGVEKEEYEQYKAKCEEALKGSDLTYFQKHFPVKIDYSERAKRMFVAERVYITDYFAVDMECKYSVQEFVDKINEI